MKTTMAIFIAVLFFICAMIVAQVIEFFFAVPRELKRIADELQKMNERKGGNG